MIDYKYQANEIVNTITLRGGNLQAFSIVLTREIKIYCMLSEGEVPLYDSKKTFGSRIVEVRRSDIICIWTNSKTGYEEFCRLDKSGQITSGAEFKHSIPQIYCEEVKIWCESQFDLISAIKEGKVELPTKIIGSEDDDTS
ncbi:MAG TPA: hypothetical protein VET47_00095 [Candidatus Limnocylindrales bacterium]|nr:hypothetical protein [Candidatus Limnocylindrales bacterium]